MGRKGRTQEAQPRGAATWLETIQSPDELREMSDAALTALAAELRDFIIAGVAVTGGHLASNLGTIELTLALLKHSELAHDRIIWDVGHQSYAYKILTGRRERFSTLRQEGGLSGFPKREESPYDSFNTGHSSTSISAALGIARGLRLRGEPGRAIAVIGDGALTGGMAYEALNDASQDDDIIVIINDNQMSIDRNVGRVAQHLDHVRTSARYLRLKSRFHGLFARLPRTGPRLARPIARLKRMFRRVRRRNSSWFESLGFRYYGPVDGHDITQLGRYLEAARAIRHPVVVHVMTQKGRGYAPAEQKPELFHGVAPFKPLHASPESAIAAADQGQQQAAQAARALQADKQPHFEDAATFTEAFGLALQQHAAEDERIVAITAAMAQGTGLVDFQRRFPTRFFDVGIAEQHAVTLAAGLAAAGMRPVVALYSTFLQRALDQVLHDIVLQGLHVVLAIDRAGIVGDDGETHQGIYDTAFLAALPGVTVLCPRDFESLAEALDYALYRCSGPVVLRYPRGGPVARLPWRPAMRPRPALPRAERLMRGRDLCIVALGVMAGVACEAALILAREGIMVEVIDARSLKPLDTEAIFAAARPSGLLISLEENVAAAGLGMQLAAALAEQGEGIELRTLAIGDHPVTQARPDRARAREGLDAEAVAEQARQLCAARRQRQLPRHVETRR